jgi:hypothetical protein
VTVEDRAVEQQGPFNKRRNVSNDQWPTEITPVLLRKEIHHENGARAVYRLQALRATLVCLGVAGATLFVLGLA